MTIYTEDVFYFETQTMTQNDYQELQNMTPVISPLYVFQTEQDFQDFLITTDFSGFQTFIRAWIIETSGPIPSEQ
jgi:hypothetical protein